MGMATDIGRARPLYDQDRQSFREFLTASAASRNLPGAMLIDKDRHVLESAETGIPLAFAAPPCGLPEQRQRKRTGNRGSARAELRGGPDPAARFQRYVSLRGAPARSARRRSAEADRGERRRICRDRSAPARRSGEFRADLCRHRADHPDGLDSAGPEFRQFAGHTDPPADGRRPHGLDRRSSCAGAGDCARKATSRNSAKPSTR